MSRRGRDYQGPDGRPDQAVVLVCEHASGGQARYRFSYNDTAGEWRWEHAPASRVASRQLLRQMEIDSPGEDFGWFREQLENDCRAPKNSPVTELPDGSFTYEFSCPQCPERPRLSQANLNRLLTQVSSAGWRSISLKAIDRVL